jgi:hypothetical protein
MPVSGPKNVERSVIGQFLGPETDIIGQFLGPQTDTICQFLVPIGFYSGLCMNLIEIHLKFSDTMGLFLGPETDIMARDTT